LNKVATEVIPPAEMTDIESGRSTPVRFPGQGRTPGLVPENFIYPDPDFVPMDRLGVKMLQNPSFTVSYHGRGQSSYLENPDCVPMNQQDRVNLFHTSSFPSPNKECSLSSELSQLFQSLRMRAMIAEKLSAALSVQTDDLQEANTSLRCALQRFELAASKPDVTTGDSMWFQASELYTNATSLINSEKCRS
jgi:hypothetical protein